MYSTYNVTERRGLETTVAVEKQYVHITCDECVFVALGTQHAIRARYIVICGLPGSTIPFHIISQTPRFSGERGEGEFILRKMCFVFLNKFVRNISLVREMNEI